MKIAVIGGGAAGFFSAIQLSYNFPEAHITLYEKSTKVLSKVLVSGGGRCNVTHACFDANELSKKYPRGERLLKPLFRVFNPEHTIAWFKHRGIELKKEADGRMFPVSDRSQTIIDCFQTEVQTRGIRVLLQKSVQKIEKTSAGLLLHFDQGESVLYDRVIVTTGGSSKESSYQWLSDLGHSIIPPIPSLFTFNMPGEPVRALMGVSVKNAEVTLVGQKQVSSGPLLITHWGMSGPAILKLSAFAARDLFEKKYHFLISVNWIAQKEHALRLFLDQIRSEIAARQVSNRNPFFLPQRLWDFILQKVEIPADKKWVDLKKTEWNRLINVLTNDQYSVQGKTTFKEEFVTCGGISFDSIDPITLQSKHCPGLYFAGEVLDIDGITGGFNFQAAWTTGYIASKLGN